MRLLWFSYQLSHCLLPFPNEMATLAWSTSNSAFIICEQIFARTLILAASKIATIPIGAPLKGTPSPWLLDFEASYSVALLLSPSSLFPSALKISHSLNRSLIILFQLPPLAPLYLLILLTQPFLHALYMYLTPGSRGWWQAFPDLYLCLLGFKFLFINCRLHVYLHVNILPTLKLVRKAAISHWTCFANTSI